MLTIHGAPFCQLRSLCYLHGNPLNGVGLFARVTAQKQNMRSPTSSGSFRYVDILRGGERSLIFACTRQLYRSPCRRPSMQPAPRTCRAGCSLPERNLSSPAARILISAAGRRREKFFADPCLHFSALLTHQTICYPPWVKSFQWI